MHMLFPVFTGYQIAQSAWCALGQVPRWPKQDMEKKRQDGYRAHRHVLTWTIRAKWLHNIRRGAIPSILSTTPQCGRRSLRNLATSPEWRGMSPASSRGWISSWCSFYGTTLQTGESKCSGRLRHVNILSYKSWPDFVSVQVCFTK